MIFGIEGAPGAGKSTVIKQLNYPSVPEMLVTPEQEAVFTDADYLDHENRKYELARSLGERGVCLLDRTRLSYHAFRFGDGEIDDDDMPVPYHQENMHYIYLSVPPELSLERRLPGHWVPTVDFTKRIINFYETQLDAMGKHATRVDATQSPDDVALTIDDIIKQLQE
jgi:thymidylate kinase